MASVDIWVMADEIAKRDLYDEYSKENFTPEHKVKTTSNNQLGGECYTKQFRQEYECSFEGLDNTSKPIAPNTLINLNNEVSVLKNLHYQKIDISAITLSALQSIRDYWRPTEYITCRQLVETVDILQQKGVI